jgi:hypothetical protein
MVVGVCWRRAAHLIATRKQKVKRQRTRDIFVGLTLVTFFLQLCPTSYVVAPNSYSNESIVGGVSQFTRSEISEYNHFSKAHQLINNS